jgi:hypothetical protein
MTMMCGVKMRKAFFQKAQRTNSKTENGGTSSANQQAKARTSNCKLEGSKKERTGIILVVYSPPVHRIIHSIRQYGNTIGTR